MAQKDLTLDTDIEIVGLGTRLPGTVTVHVQMDWAFLSYFKLESDLCESSFWGCQGTLGPKAQRKVV